MAQSSNVRLVTEAAGAAAYASRQSIVDLTAAVDDKADLDSPAFTGTVRIGGATLPTNIVGASRPGVTLIFSDVDPGVLDDGEVWVRDGDDVLTLPTTNPSAEQVVTIRADGTQGSIPLSNVGSGGGGTGSGGPRVTDLARGWVCPARGAGSALAPEETYEAFKLGASYGLGIIDGGDWWTTSDGALVCMYDSTIDRTTTGSGAVTDMTARQAQTLVVDAATWFGGNYADTTPPTAEMVLGTFSRSSVMMPEPKSLAAANALAALVGRMGLQQGVLPTAGQTAWVTPFVTVGCTNVMMNISTMPTQATMDSYKSLGINWLSIPIAGTAITPANVVTLQTNGFKIMVGITNRHVDYTVWNTSSIDGWLSDDPLYFASIVNPANATHYRRTKDPFASQTYYHGHIGSMATVPDMKPIRRGTFTGTNRWGEITWDGTQQNLWALQGWNCPLPAPTAAYTITFYATFDALGTDMARWIGMFTAMPTDSSYKDIAATYETGYHTAFRLNGELTVLKKNAGVVPAAGTPGAKVLLMTAPIFAPVTLTTALISGTAVTALAVSALPAAIALNSTLSFPTGQIATVSAAAAAGATSITINSFTPTAAVASGTAIPQAVQFSIAITATSVTFTRADTAESVALTGLTDSATRGGYWHLGIANNFGATGMKATFSQIVSV